MPGHLDSRARMTDLSKLEVGLKGSAELLVGVEHTAPASAAGAGSALEKRRQHDCGEEHERKPAVVDKASG
jgi:hypothetical protein